MNIEETHMKKTRKIKTFEVDPDVEPMLERAEEAGLIFREIANDALRDFDRRGGVKRMVKAKMARLSALSFNLPEPQLAGFLAAA